MKKKLHGILYFFCITTFLFVFSCGVLATQTEDYANEEGDDDNRGLSALSVLPGITTAATDGNLIVVLDPGHGGSESGTYTVASSSNGLYEKYYNLKVAQYCEAYLEQNYGDKVTVYLTRTSDTVLSRPERAQIAANKGADLLLSVHFNGNASSSPNGGEVFVSCLEEYALRGLANQIVSNLGDMGIKERGVFTRDSENGTLWTDNLRLADYYGIIKYPAYYEIPSCIIEHCFLTNASDYEYVTSDAKLKALGEADAKAIVSYFDLDESISGTTLANARYTAKDELTTYYNSLHLADYTPSYQTSIEVLYQDALNRINIATGTGKIDLTLDRTIATIENYPTSVAGFYDVKRSDWFSDAVVYSVENNLFNGTSTTAFSPQYSITRDMFITVIGRNSGVSGTIPCSTKFSDVNANIYYAPYIAWASENGIVEGLSDTAYGPNTAITREDLITILYRYANVEDIEITDSTGKTIANFNDGANVDDWAIQAMNWAIDCGIINGDDLNKLNPRSNTTRAEAAKIMMVFNQKGI
jgi:N-acetylmuramoyl-L-alanine amidase